MGQRFGKICKQLLFWSASAFLISGHAAAISLEIDGSNSHTSAGFVTNNDMSATVGILFPVFSHLQLGLTYRYGTQHQKGLMRREGESETDRASYTEFERNTVANITGGKVVVILYSGLFSPYVFLGGARHQYEITQVENNAKIGQKVTIPFLPNYGFGVAILLNRDFSLKVSQTYSPGVQEYFTEDGVRDAKGVIDSYTELGIEYRI